jgi:hypothetical protein
MSNQEGERMRFRIHRQDNSVVAIIESNELLLTDVQTAVQFLSDVYEETGCSKIIIKKESIPEAFFDLKTKLAGEILQKFVNYQTKLAIVGDFQSITSKSLHDFIYESNKGHDFCFVATEEEALTRLHRW